MNNLSKVLSSHLQANDSNAVRISSHNSRLSKGARANNKFAFTFNDIIEKFGGVDNLLDELPTKGFTNVKFTLVKIYSSNGKSTYHKVNEITKNLTEKEMNPSTQHIPQPPLYNGTQNNYGLGAALAAPEVINSMVEAGRSSDYKKRAEDAEEKLKDANSENRILREELASLKIKLATAEDRAELQRKQDRLDQKSFWEGDTGQTVMETLGGIITKGMEMVTPPINTPTPTPTLGASQIQLSEVKTMVIESVKSSNFSDQQANIINYILQNWEKEFIETIMELIKQRESNG
ncbi:hypothetical protein R5O24_07745 [Tenacibaculum maritimum]|uniref:hypothetical protein n=1 Tax=Tenacibaculum maritimum TaxID=107401 RepID=UPI00388D7997